MTWIELFRGLIRLGGPFTLFPRCVNAELAVFRAETSRSSPDPRLVPEREVRVSDLDVTRIRTPVQQAELVVKGRSWTCSSSHKTDKARHVALYKNGTYVAKPSLDLTPLEYRAFTAAWNLSMKAAGLRNYAGKHGFNETDAYHVELPDSKLPFADKRVQEWLHHYARKTRDEGRPRNVKFENNDERVRRFLQRYPGKGNSAGVPAPPTS